MDELNLDKQVLFMFPDSVCDLNNMFFSAQIFIICLSVQNVDMLIALRPCLTESWVNQAEWVMSLLNLAL